MCRPMLYFRRSVRSSTPISASSSGVRSASSSPALWMAVIFCCWRVSSVMSRVRAIWWVMARAVEDRGRGDSEVAIGVDPQDRAGRPFRRDGGGERAGERAEDLGRAKRPVKRRADRLDRGVGQERELGVGPDDPEVGVDDGHAVGDRVEDLIGLDQDAGPADRRELRRVDVDPGELLLADQDHRSGHGPGADEVEALGQETAGRGGLRRVTLDDQESGLVGHEWRLPPGLRRRGWASSRPRGHPLFDHRRSLIITDQPPTLHAHRAG